MVEYAGLTAALTILVASLNGVFATALPSTGARADTLVSTIARSHGVPAPEARAAYAAAPYPKPALRYLYAVGWVGSVSSSTTCKVAQVLGPDPATAATQALQGSPSALGMLRRAHITISQAANAFARGSADGCK
jgi:hypothetical protein